MEKKGNNLGDNIVLRTMWDIGDNCTHDTIQSDLSCIVSWLYCTLTPYESKKHKIISAISRETPPAINPGIFTYVPIRDHSGNPFEIPPGSPPGINKYYSCCEQKSNLVLFLFPSFQTLNNSRSFKTPLHKKIQKLWHFCRTFIYNGSRIILMVLRCCTGSTLFDIAKSNHQLSPRMRLRIVTPPSKTYFSSLTAH